MNLRRAGLIILGVVAVALLLLNRKDVQIKEQTGFELKRISASGYELSSVIRINNPNLLSSTITLIDETFFINGKVIGELNNELEQGIAGMTETEFPVSIRLSNEDLEKIIPADSLKDANAEISVTGEIAFRNLTGAGKITVNERDSVLIKTN